MKPRLLFYTHYQVDEPAYMEFLTKLCTSGVQSSYADIVINKLTNEVRARSKKEFNKAAGGYAVELARALDIITENNIWTAKGFLINLLADINDDSEDQLSLNLEEKLLHLRIFIEADGAAFIYLARKIISSNSLPPEEIDKNAFILSIFIDIYSDYLSYLTHTADRVMLRKKIEQLKNKGYKGHTGPHKLFIHLQTLYRLGLLDRKDANSRTYYLPEQSGSKKSGLEVLLKDIPDIMVLEKAVDSHKLIEIAASALGLSYRSWKSSDMTDTLKYFAQFYESTISIGVPFCSVSTLLEATQITLLKSGILLKYNEMFNLITTIQRERPKQIRFHVDRRGRPAFIKMSDEVVGTLISDGVIT